MATKEEREDRKKRIERTKDTDNLIADNGLDGKVIDVYDILARSNSPVVIKLRKLNQYGITDEMIAELYASNTGNVETKETAIDNLKTVYKNLVRYINKMPNGIVIDPRTGEKDQEASYRQAVRVGIENDSFYKEQQKIGQQVLKEFIKEGKLPGNENNVSKFDKFIDRKYIKNTLKREDDTDEKIEAQLKKAYIKNALIRKMNELENIIDSYKDNSFDITSIPIEERAEEAKVFICIMFSEDGLFSEQEKRKAYEYIYKLFPDCESKEQNGLLREIISINEHKDIETVTVDDCFDSAKRWSNEQIELYGKEATEYVKIGNEILLIEAKLQYTDKNTPEYISLMDRMNKIYEKNPQYNEKLNLLRNENGSLTLEAQNMVNEYVGTIRDITLDKIIEKTDISKLSEDDKNKYATYLLVAATTKTNINIAEKAISTLKQMYPDIASSIEKNNENNTLIEQVTTALLGEKVNYEDEINLMRETINKILIENRFERFIDKEKDSANTKISDKEVEMLYAKESVELLTGIDLTKSTLQNKFNKDSKMEFSKTDEKTYMELFQKSSIGSWISNKEEVIFHRYMALLLLEDKLTEEEIKNGATKYKITQNMLEKMQTDHPDLAKKILEFSPEKLQELKEQEKVFEKNKLNSKVLDFYQKNVLTLKPNYYGLEKQDKYEFLRITILSRELAKRADTPEESQMLLKLSNRALEIMNTDENKFIEFDENGNGIINEKALLFEYRNYTTANRLNGNSLDEVGKNLYEKYQRSYFIGKMTEYSKLKDSDFGELASKSDEEKLSEIISFKERKNRERLDSLTNQQQSIETNESEEKIGEKQSILRTENISTNDRDSKSLTEVVPDKSIISRLKTAFNGIKNNVKAAFKKVKDVFAGKKTDENNIESNQSNSQTSKRSQESAFDKYIVEGVSGRIQEQEQNKTETVEKGKKAQEAKTEEYEDITM